MKGKFAVLIGVLSISAATVHAGINLQSQDLSSGSGSHVIIIPAAWPAGTQVDTLTPTVFTHGAFPQDASNSITFDSSGMKVLVNRQGNFDIGPNGGHSNLYQINHHWNVGA